MANPSVRPRDLSGNISQRLATLNKGKPVYNRGAIMRQAWRLYRYEQQIDARLKARGEMSLPLTFGECMKQAWESARGLASSLQYSETVNKAPAEERRVVDLQMRTRLGVAGLKQLGSAIAERARAAL